MTDGKKMQSIRAQAEKNTKHGRYFFVFAIAVIFIFFLIFVFLNFFNVKNIAVFGLENSSITPEQIIEICTVKPGDNLFGVKKSRVENAILSKYPYIKEVDIQKAFPKTLKLNITLDTPAMSFVLGEDTFIISSEGKVLDAIGEDEVVPEGICEIVLPSISECIVGEKVGLREEEILETLIETYCAFLDSGIAHRLTYLDATNKFNIDAVLDERFEIVFGSWENAGAKAKLISEVLSNDIWTDASGIIDVSDSREAVVRLTGSSAN